MRCQMWHFSRFFVLSAISESRMRAGYVMNSLIDLLYCSGWVGHVTMSVFSYHIIYWRRVLWIVERWREKCHRNNDSESNVLIDGEWRLIREYKFELAYMLRNFECEQAVFAGQGKCSLEGLWEEFVREQENVVLREERFLNQFLKKSKWNLTRQEKHTLRHFFLFSLIHIHLW